MVDRPHLDLSRRERQIMEVLHRVGWASVAEVLDEMPDPPSYSAVRATLGLLVEKGHARHRKDGRRYLYAPTVGTTRARRSAIRNVLRTFFDDSVEQAVASLLDVGARDLSEEEYERLQRLIDEARRQGGES